MQRIVGLKQLEEEIRRERAMLASGEFPWVIPSFPSKPTCFDVVIVGAGMAGLAVAFQLQQAGIFNFRIIDTCMPGLEGPWNTYARMKMLRSTKDLVGPAYNFPLLTFQAWYEAQYGESNWQHLGKIPTHLWMEYLGWFREMLQLPVQNCAHLVHLEPVENLLKLSVIHGDMPEDFMTRKLVLATGRGGFGGVDLPEFVKDLPKGYYSHTCEEIDFRALKGKRLCVFGAGASAFDAAAVALEAGVGSVTLLLRRKHVPKVNKLASLTYYGMSAGFYHLSDEERYAFMVESWGAGGPPPHEALDRVQGYSNFFVKGEAHIQCVFVEKEELVVLLTQEELRCDYMILATGFKVDGTQQPELRDVADKILFWKDRGTLPKDAAEKFGSFPYLGPHFEFLEKKKGEAPFLKHLYCFNYAATLSHGLISSDVPGIGVGAHRVAAGIAADLFIENSRANFENLVQYNQSEFDPRDYPFLP
ncbi:MAG: NAD(P)-binding domain-containing protein [Parachlamydiaceae bacterium]|nr:NAD(P)-binding domain-containing protein [Parachlamydiaceae bacterium]